MEEVWRYLHSYKDVSHKDIQEAKKEQARVQELIQNYPGYSVTFSTQNDALTNLLWKQGTGEVDFKGRFIHAAILGLELDDVRETSFPYLAQKLFGITMDSVYLGQVIAIDRNQGHDMSAIVEDREALSLMTHHLLNHSYAVDIHQDGTVDWDMDASYLTARSLYFFKGGQDKRSICLDFDGLGVLRNRLQIEVSEIETLKSVTQSCLEEVDQILASHATRTKNLKESILSYLESMNLIRIIEEINKNYEDYEKLRADLDDLSAYSVSSFSAHFDATGESRNYDYFDGNHSYWDYGFLKEKLQKLVSSAVSAHGDISNNISEEESETELLSEQKKVYMKTSLGLLGVDTINSFKDTIEKSSQGLENRSHFEDGIAQAVKEILQVILDNLGTLSSCIHYLIEATGAIRETMQAQDQIIATGISSLDMSGVMPIDVPAIGDYQAYLQDSQVFDDREVLMAFDHQVDTKSSELAQGMDASFEDYLDQAHSVLSTSNSCLNELRGDLEAVEGELNEELYYQKKESPHLLVARASVGSVGTAYYPIQMAKEGKEESTQLWGKKRSAITIASLIESTLPRIRTLDQEMTEIATSINSLVVDQADMKGSFQTYMEEAVYGVEGLSAIVKAQKGLGMTLATSIIQFQDLQTQLQAHQGLAIDALSEKVSLTIQYSQLVTQIIMDCFGNKVR